MKSLKKARKAFIILWINFRCGKEDEDIVCADDVKQAIESDTYCGLIRKAGGPFGECIVLSNAIDPSIIDTYYEECEYDVCALWGDADDQVCSALETFLSYCYDIGASAISFRTDSFCPGILIQFLYFRYYLNQLKSLGYIMIVLAFTCYQLVIEDSWNNYIQMSLHH